jgi:archaellin
MRTFNFTFTVTCASNGRANKERVEEMIDLAMQDLVYDDEFIAALDESQSVTIQVSPQFGQPNT